MWMNPFFPSLIPPIVNNVWFNTNVSLEDETEVSKEEQEHQEWLTSIEQTGMDLHPLGKIQKDHLEPVDSDDDDANDDSEDSESHDEEEEDDMDMINALDRDRMETNYSPEDTR